MTTVVRNICLVSNSSTCDTRGHFFDVELGSFYTSLN